MATLRAPKGIQIPITADTPTRLAFAGLQASVDLLHKNISSISTGAKTTVGGSTVAAVPANSSNSSTRYLYGIGT